MALVTLPGLHNHSHKENQTGRGQIQVIFGPMFSGKTTELLRRLRRYQHANHRTFLIKYEKDNRYDMNGVSTHDRQVSSAVSCSKLYELKKSIGPYNVIGIDEGQFFPDVVDFAEDMANNGKIVIVAALDGTFQRQGFGNILNLVPLAESVVKLSAVCMHCYGEGSFTKRLGLEVEVEVIGGADKYMATCRSCHPRKILAKTNTSKENKENVCRSLKKLPLDSVENKVDFCT